MLLSKADQLEAERQRADAKDNAINFATEIARKASDKIERLEEEIAELKGDQVPVAYLIHEKAKPARLSFQNLKGFVSQSDIEEHELWQEELFTAPQKPVVPDAQTWDELCRKNPEMTMGDAIIRAASWNACRDAMLSAAIEAAGGIVKDGE